MRNEEKTVRLFHAIADVGDDLVDDAKTPPANAKAPARRRWGALAACLCLIVLAGAGVWWHWMWLTDDALPPDPGLPSVTADTNDPDPGSKGSYIIPKGIAPVLRVGDTLYEWTGLSVEQFLDDSGAYCAMGGATYLPEGFYEYGAISGVTVEEPTEELQLQAGFEASGTVFVSEEYPAAVYVLMHTDWFAEEGAYIRFASDALGGSELVSWQGRAYRFSYYYSDSPVLEVLPEGCEPIGHLRYVGADSIPAGDLETNRRGDDYGKPLEGRKVCAVPGDDSVLYVYEPRYRQEDGHYAWHPFWRVCRLWEP